MKLARAFIPGMYVRIPAPEEIGREDSEFRDFRIGQIVSIDDIALTAEVSLQTHTTNQEPHVEHIECSLDGLERCHILPDTRFTHIPSGHRGTILIACDNAFPPDMLCSYYAQIDGQTKRVSESDIAVSSVRQDPTPANQLRHYEFHNPIWKSYRDQFIEDYSELHNASFGIEDLIGSRVMLLPHQAEVITRALSSTRCRYLLADEVGLGKTIEACVILKSLRRRQPGMKTLIIVPASLVQQWYNELNDKFWLTFVIARPGAKVPAASPGVIMSAEDLATHDTYWEWASTRSWGLLITDEAHRLRKDAGLSQRIQQLSREAERVLILTATPIQRQASDYLALLQLLDPERYKPMDHPSFERILAAQGKVRQAIVYLKPNLTEAFFDGEEFQEEIDRLINELGQDYILKQLVDEVKQHADAPILALEKAKEVIAYVSENYRIEGRIIRNRRASLNISLPVRERDTTWSYHPDEDELAALDELYGYIDFFLDAAPHEPPHLEYCRILLHASASSPHALLFILALRKRQVTDSIPINLTSSLAELSTPSDPRQETKRVAELVQALPVLSGENDALSRSLWHTRRWLEQTEQNLADISLRECLQQAPSHRLVQAFTVFHQMIEENPDVKVVVFSHWVETLSALLSLLERFYPRSAVAQFHAEMDQDELQQAVDRFQSDDSCHILLCDELGGEGRNFQIADGIIHLDLPWTPAQIEQRIGRVDRLGRSGVVSSIVLFGRGTLEQDLFRIWDEAFHLFTRSMSGMEIALEGIQNELAQALTQSTRHGLARILPDMITRATLLHEAVEEERYFEEGAINHRLRQQFQTMSEQYRDGSCLRNIFLPWAKLAGLTCNYHKEKDTVQFYPREFNLRSMANAKFLPPNMEEALHRSRNPNNPVITGTFNRDKAVQREDLVFFAPSDDPWTDAIIANAMEADRGRCCAIRRSIPEREQNWRGFELLYRLRLDPRPLYAAGYDPSHLFRAQGFLVATTYRVLLSIDGQVIKKSDPISQYIKRDFQKGIDIHLGKRDPPAPQIHTFKARYPQPLWHTLIAHILHIAEAHIHEEYGFTDELAEEARQEFAHHASGWRAARRWFMRETGEQFDMDEIAEYEGISAKLVEGIRHPIIKLESVCYWELQGTLAND